MKKLLAILFFTLMFFSVKSQSVKLIPSVDASQRWGAVDTDNKVVIPFEYDKISFYSFDYLLVDKNGNKGLYDESGKEVLSPKYDAVKPLSKYLFQVTVNRKVGVLSKSGKVILSSIYTSIVYDESKSTFIVSKNNKRAIFNNKGNELTPFDFDNISFYGDNYYLFKLGNKFAVSENIKSLSELKFYDDVVKDGAIFHVRDNNKWGVLNSKCERIIKLKYESVKLSDDGKFILIKKNDKYAFADLEGDRITKFIFNDPLMFFDNNVCWAIVDQAWYRFDFETQKGDYLELTKVIDGINGYVRVIKNNYVELVDNNEVTLFNRKYQDIIPLNDTLFKVQFMRKWGVVNINDEVVIDLKFDQIDFNTLHEKVDYNDDRFKTEEDEIISDIYADLFTVAQNQKFGVYSITGNEIVPIAYNKVDANVYNLMIRVKNKEGYNVYSRQGVKLFENNYKSILWNENQKYFTLRTDSTLMISDTLGNLTKFKNIEDIKWTLKPKLFFVTQNNKYGIVNINFDTIVKPKYKQLYDLGRAYFVGVVDSGVFLLGNDGVKLLNDELNSIERVESNSGSYLILSKQDKVGVIDEKGNQIIPFEYSRISFDKTHQLFRVESNSKFKGYFSVEGKKYF